MDYKALFKKILYPPLWVFLLLTPASAALLVCSFLFFGEASPLSILSYVVSFYTLCIYSVRIPNVIAFFKRMKQENKYVRRWLEDPRLRVNVSLYSSLGLNTAYALLQLGLGIHHSSFWFYSLACYYLCLVLMRFFLAKYLRKNKKRSEMQTELVKYRFCGWVLLFMNLALSVIILFMIRFGRTFVHHEITTIALAAYTFTALTLAIINVVKYRKYESPVYSASRAVNLAAAAVSLLTLESTMLTTFGDGSMSEVGRRILLALSGAGVCAFVMLMAIMMIVVANKRLKSLKENENGQSGE